MAKKYIDAGILKAEIERLENYTTFSEQMAEELLAFIDNLQEPENTPSWKPSEEQMEVLEAVERWYSDNMGCNLALVSLCEQLKKLIKK